MDEDIMGKVFHKDKLRPFKMRGVFAAVFIAVLLMTVPDSRASYREFELFDKAYELYLSYQPEKAAETFGVFLKEFPQSSAADAALFWLGRCYLQLKLYGEAEKYFSEIKRQFPDSPFMRFAERETAMFAVVKDASEAGGSTRREDGKGTVSQTGATQKKEEEVVAGISIATAQEDKAPQGLQIQEEVRTREVKEVASVIVSEDAKESVAQTSAIEKKEEVVAGVSIATAQEDKAPQGSQIQEEVRTTEVKQAAAAIVGEEAKESVEQTSAIEQEKEEVDVGISSPTAQEDKAPQDLQTQEEVKKTDGRQVAAVIIKGNRHAANEITELMKRVASVRIGAGIKGIPWQTGDAFGDFISEEVLYDEAKRSGVSADSEKLGELTRRYRLTAVESEVVGRYLAILSLVQMKIKNVSEGRMIETLTVQYTDAGNEDKISLAGRLQEQAREGKSFEEISKLYPGFAAYSVMKFQDLQDWLKNSVKGLRAGDVSVIWKGNGYMALKPLGTGSLFGMPTVDSDGGDAVKVFMKDWVEELGRDRAIEIIYD